MRSDNQTGSLSRDQLCHPAKFIQYLSSGIPKIHLQKQESLLSPCKYVKYDRELLTGATA